MCVPSLWVFLSLGCWLPQYGAKRSLELKALGTRGRERTGVRLFPSATLAWGQDRGPQEKRRACGTQNMARIMAHAVVIPVLWSCDSPNKPVQGVVLIPSSYRWERRGSECLSKVPRQSLPTSSDSAAHHAVVQPQTWLTLVAVTTVLLATIRRGLWAGTGPSAVQGELFCPHNSPQAWTLVSDWGPGTRPAGWLVRGSWRSSNWRALLRCAYRGLKPYQPAPSDSGGLPFPGVREEVANSDDDGDDDDDIRCRFTTCQALC